MLLVAVICTAATSAFVTSPVETAFGGNVGEPYKALHDGAFTGRPAPHSPDPLAAYQWNGGLADTASLQAYTLRPVTVVVREGMCTECDTLTKPGVATAKLTATPASPVRLMLDFGVELPAWFEFDSRDNISVAALTMAIGEYDQPWQDTGANSEDFSWKLGPPHAFTGPKGVTTYRLHTNAELYEGVRYAFLTLTSGSFTISALRLVVQTKPVNYTGHFAAPSDSLLESVWWVAAWTVRANFMEDFFGSILIDRGDRESWTGDAHPIQAAALVAFHNLDSIKQNLKASINGAGGGFPTYQSYWVLSVMDYYHYTGDGAVLATYAAHIETTMMPLVKSAMSGTLRRLGFVGWDDRTGGGFANSSCVECNKDFHFILLRAVNDSAHAYAAPGVGHNATFAAELTAAVTSLVAYLRQPLAGGAPWYDDLLLPSASDAIDSGITTAAEEAFLFTKLFTDPITICQLSPFNEYWTLQALGRMGKHEEALWVLRKCWGGMIELGGTMFWETFAQAPEWISGDWQAAPTAALPTRVPWSWSGTTSLAHPWGAGPAHWMSLELLGVKPTAPGFNRFEIKPRLAKSLRAVNGVVPTVHGAFEVSFDLTQREATVVVPFGGIDSISSIGSIEGHIAIPLLPGDVAVTHLQINGSEWVELNLKANGARVAATDDVDNIVMELHIRQDRVHWIDASFGPGRHTIRWKLLQDVTTAAAEPPSPFPPPNYPMTTVGRDNATQGNWREGKYGSEGYQFYHYCASAPGGGGSGESETCASVKETQTARLSCVGGGNDSIKAITFADFGTPSGVCASSSGSGNFAHDPTCTTANFAAIVTTHCVGAKSCTVECSDYKSLSQQGCTFHKDGSAAAINVTLPIACALPKAVKLNAECAVPVPPAPACNETQLPSFVNTVTNSYNRGKLLPFNTKVHSVNDPADKRSLQLGATSRSVGKLADAVVFSIDVEVPNVLQQWRLSAYFVDWERQGRSQQVSILNATESTYPIAAAATLLSDFGEGAYLTWNVTGSVRIRVSHVGGGPTLTPVNTNYGGADAVVSGIFFDLL